MNKLTAEKCRQQIEEFQHLVDSESISTKAELHFQAYRIALPILEQQERGCQKCGGTGMADSGGTQPWGEQILIECDCVIEQQKKGNDGWIEWHGGDCPVGGACQVKLRAGLELTGPATSFLWWNDGDFDDGDIIAYRVIK